MASTQVVDLANRTLLARTDRIDAPANQVTLLPAIALDPLLADGKMVLVSLRLTDEAGRLVSENFYWRGKDPAAYRALNSLPPAPVRATLLPGLTSGAIEGGDRLLQVSLINEGQVAALATKITLTDAAGARILPAYYSDNYISLLPGQRRTIEIRYPQSITATPKIALRGWNVVPAVASTGP